METLPVGIEPDCVRLTAYEEASQHTDQMPPTLDMPLLGLFGEVGSLLSELKKRRRDDIPNAGYQSAVLEEFGDVLWYFCAIARRGDLRLAQLAQRVGRNISDWDERLDDPDATFGGIDKSLPPVRASEKFESGLVSLAGHVGDLMNDWHAGKLTANRDVLSGHLVEILRAVALAARSGGHSLDQAASRNIAKIYSRWPLAHNYPEMLDENLGTYERLPRRLVIYFDEHEVNGRIYVTQVCNGLIVGDRLTDNKVEQDDYRFHDVFHLAYAVFLGWSPVLRALLKLKRKSLPSVDENQDGARAILIEEGIATFVFARALERQLFENQTQVSYDLLKTIQAFVVGYEPERCSLWQWERAILVGFEVFRQLQKHRRGYVTADLTNHALTFQSTKPV